MYILNAFVWYYLHFVVSFTCSITKVFAFLFELFVAKSGFQISEEVDTLMMLQWVVGNQTGGGEGIWVF